MNGLAISNDGEVPLPAIELLGATTKADDSSTIGMFGTGFKYALALALRQGLDVQVMVGGATLQFFTEKVDIGRGTEVDRICIRLKSVFSEGQRAKVIRTSWTTQLGYKDWIDKPKEGIVWEWMVLREFLSNAIDEGGMRVEFLPGVPSPQPGRTIVWVGFTHRIPEVWAYIGDYLLSMGNAKPLHVSDGGAVYSLPEEGESVARIYHKGVFVRTTSQPLLFSYDLPDMVLNESRSVDEWSIRSGIGGVICSLPVGLLAATMGRVNKDYHNDPSEQSIETGLTSYCLNLQHDQEKTLSAWTQAFGTSAVLVPPAEEVSAYVLEVARRSGKKPIQMPLGWHTGLSRVKGLPTVDNAFDEDILQGFRFLSAEEIEGINVARRAAYEDAYQWVSKWFSGAAPTFKVYEWKGSRETDSIGPLGMSNGSVVALNLEHPLSTMELRATLVEEFAHHLSGVPDYSRALVDFLTRSIADAVNRPLVVELMGVRTGSGPRYLSGE